MCDGRPSCEFHSRVGEASLIRMNGWNHVFSMTFKSGPQHRCRRYDASEQPLTIELSSMTPQSVAPNTTSVSTRCVRWLYCHLAIHATLQSLGGHATFQSLGGHEKFQSLGGPCNLSVIRGISRLRLPYSGSCFPTPKSCQTGVWLYSRKVIVANKRPATSLRSPPWLALGETQIPVRKVSWNLRGASATILSWP